jgi:hypothetical protein
MTHLNDYFVYSFNFPKKNQYLRHCIQFLTLLSLASFILLVRLIPKMVEQKFEGGFISGTKFLGTIPVD